MATFSKWYRTPEPLHHFSKENGIKFVRFDEAFHFHYYQIAFTDAGIEDMQGGTQLTLFEFVNSKSKPLVRAREDQQEDTNSTSGRRPRLGSPTTALPAVLDTRVSSMYDVPTLQLSRSMIRKHTQSLTMIPKDKFQKAEDASFAAYVLTDTTLKVPRWYGKRMFGAAQTDATHMGIDISNHAAEFAGKLNSHQIPPVSRMMDVYNDQSIPSPRGGMICLGCGQGKTVCALSIISQLKRRTLVLCHKAFLVEQWIQRARAFLPNATIGIVRQSKVDVNADIVIASLQSVALREYEEDTFENFGLLVIDEAHHLSAPCLSRALQKLPMRYVLALSATPERRDGLSSLLYDSMGPIVYRTERPAEYVRVSRLIYNNRSKQVELLGKDNKPMFSRMLNNIANDSTRTAIVARHLNRHLQHGRQIIVLSDRISQLEAVASSIVALGTSSGNVALYIGRCTASEREAASTKQLILSTYSLAREGLDLARLDTLCLLTPSSSVEQATGRILRPNSDKKTPLVLDVVDPFSIFSHMSQRRMRYYKSRSYEVQDAFIDEWTVEDSRWFT